MKSKSQLQNLITAALRDCALDPTANPAIGALGGDERNRGQTLTEPQCKY